jgi:hypothetical protein
MTFPLPGCYGRARHRPGYPREAASAPMHGVMVGPLRESYSDRVVVGDSTFFLRGGEQCLYPFGARVQVVYADASGRCEAESITLVLA